MNAMGMRSNKKSPMIQIGALPMRWGPAGHPETTCGEDWFDTSVSDRLPSTSTAL